MRFRVFGIPTHVQFWFWIIAVLLGSDVLGGPRPVLIVEWVAVVFVSIMIHELGHAIHSHLSMQSQSSLEWRYPPFLAEIASTCNEMLFSRYMIDKAASKQEKAWLLSELYRRIGIPF